MDRDTRVEVLEIVRRAARDTAISLRDGADGFEAMSTFVAKLEDAIEIEENRD